MLRRNPTDAERILWQALTRDRRFAGQFKHFRPPSAWVLFPDFVSFVHRIAIELVDPRGRIPRPLPPTSGAASLAGGARSQGGQHERCGVWGGDLATELVRLEASPPKEEK